MKQETKYVYATISLLAGASSLTETSLQLEKDWDVCDGVAVNELTKTAADNYRVGLTDKAGIVHDRVDADSYVSSTAVPPNDRFKDILIKSAGNTVNIGVEPVAALAGNLLIDVIFRLRRNKSTC